VRIQQEIRSCIGSDAGSKRRHRRIGISSNVIETRVHRKLSRRYDPLKKRVDILFIFCPYVGHPPPHRFDINLGAAYLAAYLKRQGLRASFYYGWYDNDPGFGHIRDSLKRINPRAVGFTVYGSNLPETVAVSQAIKKEHPELPIIWGGPEVRFRAKDLIDTYRDAVDVCISGEGEKPLLRLLTSDTPGSIDERASIGGVSFFNRESGEIISTNPAPTLLEDTLDLEEKQGALDLYPSPYLEGVVPERYFRDKTVVGIFTSRGCPFACSYCQFSSLSNHKVHFFSVDRVVAEIQWIHERVRRFHPQKEDVMIMIYDEALTLSRKRVEDLCERLIRENFKPAVKFWVETRADYVDAAFIGLLKRAGVKKIGFGLESAVPRVLKRIRKVTPRRNRDEADVEIETRFLSRIKQAVKWSKDQGLFTAVSIIVGLPTESMADAGETLRFVKDLDVDVYYHNFLNVLEGTELAGESGALGYDCGAFPLGYMGKYGHRYTKAPIPTRSLQPLKNAMVFRRDRTRFGVLLRGWGYAGKCTRLVSAGMRFRPFVLGLELRLRSFDIDRLFFQQLAGLSTTLFYPDDGCFSDAELAGILERLPLKNGRLHGMPSYGSSAKRIRGVEEADQSTPYFIRFKDLDHAAFPDDGRSIFVEIKDRSDFESLVGFVRKYESESEESLSYEQADTLHFDLFESCRWFRWFDATCPAASLTHIYCDERGGLRPCVHFPPMGDIRENVSLEAFRERTESHIREKTGERGCRECPVKAKCPQCIAPFPLTDEEYCNFQRGRRVK